jgi:hypothetical protein
LRICGTLAACIAASVRRDEARKSRSSRSEFFAEGDAAKKPLDERLFSGMRRETGEAY